MSKERKTLFAIVFSRYWLIAGLLVVDFLFICIINYSLGRVSAQVKQDDTRSFESKSTLIANGQFTVTTIGTGDLDNDGTPEIVTGGNFTHNAQLRILDDVSGNWYDVVTSSPPINALALADFDNDGYIDIATVSNLTSVEKAEIWVWWNDHTPLDGHALTGTRVITLNCPVLVTATQTIAVGDLNQDGYPDIVSGDRGGQVFHFDLKDPPSRAEWDPHPIPTANPSNGVTAIALADFYMDGKLEIVIGGNNPFSHDLIMKRQRGVSFVTCEIADLTEHGDFVNSITVFDFDNDGDPDIATGSKRGDITTWESKLGESQLDCPEWPSDTVGSVSDAIHSLTSTDLDNDGDLELVSGNNGQTGEILVWTFETTSWQSTGLSITGTMASLDTSDLDRDGDIDIVFGNNHSDHFEIAQWENTLIHRNMVFGDTLVDVAPSITHVNSLAVGDLDQDGYPDLVAGGYFTTSNKLVAWRNTHSAFGSFWTQNVINDFADLSVSVIAIADLDKDGKPDIVSGDENEYNRLRGCKSVGSPFTGTWSCTDIEAMCNKITALAIADFNLDGFSDIVAGSSSRFIIYQNDKTPFDGPWSNRRIIDENGEAIKAVDIADLDNDGDWDIASVSEDQVVIWENPLDILSDDPFATWEPNNITMTFASAQAVVVTDFDNDGHVDIAAAGSRGIYVWENDGTPFLGAWNNGNRISTTSMDALVIADFDHDGDPDLVSSHNNYPDNKLIVWENDGAPFEGSWSQHDTFSMVGNTTALAAGDFDRDGDADLVIGGEYSMPEGIALWRNQGGSVSLQALAIPQTLTNSLQAPFLQITATHHGIPDDHDIELAQWSLRFEEQTGDPVTTAEAAALISNLAIYYSANATWQVTDTPILTIPGQNLALDSEGIRLVDFPISDTVQIAPGVPKTYFIVLTLATDAADQVPNTFQITFDPMATLSRDRTTQAPARRQYTPPISTGFQPEASFSNVQFAVVQDTVVRFTNTTSGTEPLEYTWDLGDGSPLSHADNPTYVYEQKGVFTITLTATNPYGEDYAYGTVDVGTAPEASFRAIPNLVQTEETVVFFDQSTGDLPLNCTWDFGDGSLVSQGNHTTHIYHQSGIFTVTLTVTNSYSEDVVTGSVTVNDAPVAADDMYITAEETLLTVDASGVLSNDSDAEDDPLTAELDSAPLFGALTLNADGSFTYMPTDYFDGVVTFTYRADDGTWDSNLATVTITVSAVNDAPTLDALSDLTIDEDAELQTVSLSGIGSGAPNETQPLHVAAASTNTDLITQPVVTYTSPNITGSLSFAPVEDEYGTVTVVVTVSDGLSETSRSFVVTVNAVNDAPTLNDLPDLTIDEDAGQQTVSLSGIGSGVPNEIQTLHVTAISTNTSLISLVDVNYTSPDTTGCLSFVPQGDQYGSATVIVTVSDGLSETSRSLVVTVNAVNDPPKLDALPDLTIDEDAGLQTVGLSGISSGAPNEIQTLHVTATSTNVSLISLVDVNYTSPDATGYLNFTSQANQYGTATVVITITDGLSETIHSFLVTVNAVPDPPIAEDDTANTPEDISRTIMALGNDSDPDGDALEITAVGQPVEGTITFTNRSITYTPTHNFNGPVVFTYTVSDPGGLSDTATITVTVGAVNDPPVAEDDTANTPEETMVVIDVLVNDQDPDRDTLDLDSITQPENGTTVIDRNTVIYTPTDDFNGQDTFHYQVSDGQLTDTTTVIITVSAVNDAPTLDALSDLTIDEDAESQPVGLIGIGSGAPNETQRLTVTATSTNTGLITQPVVTYTSPNITGSLSFAPVEDEYGTATIVVTVSDGLSETSRSFVVTVNAVNDAPTLNNLPDLTIDEDAELQTVSLNGIGSGAPDEIQPLHVTAASTNTGLITQPTVIYASPNTTGCLSFAPQANQYGTAMVIVTVSDGLSEISRTFVVTVNAVNDAPTLDALSDLTVDEDAGWQAVGLSGIGSGVSNEIQTLHVTATSTNTSLISHLSIIYTSPYTTGCLSFAPVEDEYGTATIVVTVTDGFSETSRSLQVIVNAVPDPPAAKDDAVSTQEDITLSIDVLNNDDDPDGDALSLVSVTQPASGTTVIYGNAAIYTPDRDFNGQDIFCYTVSDGELNDIAMVTVTIIPVEDLPTAAFTPTMHTIQVGEMMTFTNLSTGDPPLKSTWDFGDGSSLSYIDNPAHVYTQTGEFTVTLTVTNICGEDETNGSATVIPVFVYLPITMKNYVPPSLHLSTKTVDSHEAYPGEILQYTITLTNSGTVEAPSVTVTDTIPISCTYVPGSVTGGRLEEGAIRWSGSLNPLNPHVLSYRAKIDESVRVITIVNEVRIDAGITRSLSRLATTRVLHVKNGGFEEGWTGWSYNGELSQSISSNHGHSHDSSALLGNPSYDCNDGVPIGSAWIEQTVFVPPIASPKLHFWYNIFTQDQSYSPPNGTYDSFDVSINRITHFRDADQNQEKDPNCKNPATDLGWQPGEIDLSAYKGEYITIRFENWSRHDNYFNTWTYVDDVQILP